MDLKFIKKNSLFLFLFFSFLILGILVLTNYFSAKNLENDILTQYNEHRDLLLEKAALNIENDILTKGLELNLLEKKIILDEIIFNSCSNKPFLPQIKQKTNLENYFIINKNGKIISCSNSNYLDYLNLNIKDTNYFKEFLNSKTTIIKYIKTSKPGQIYFLIPITNSKQNKYDAIGILSIIEINNLYSKYIHELVGNDNYYYLLDKTNNEIIIKSSDLSQTKINSLENNSKQNQQVLIMNNENFIFNKKQFKVGSEIWEIGLFSSTKQIGTLFSILNKKHLISIIFILIILIILFIILLKTHNQKIDVEKKLENAKLILKKFKLNLEPETLSNKSLSNNKLKEGNIFFIRDDFQQAYELFIQEINNKKIGFGFLKSDIDKFKQKYNLDKTTFVQLGKEKDKNSKYETIIESKTIFNLIFDFLKKTNKPKIIFIDYLDYIILQNSFNDVLIGLYELKEKIKSTNNILLFSINQNVISNRELLALEKEFIDIETEEKKSLQNISKLEIDILTFINKLNNNKVEVRYKDISIKFNITKPTTTKKINQLEKNKFIKITDMGRRKTIEITQKGRKII